MLEKRSVYLAPSPPNLLPFFPTLACPLHSAFFSFLSLFEPRLGRVDFWDPFLFPAGSVLSQAPCPHLQSQLKGAHCQG